MTGWQSIWFRKPADLELPAGGRFGIASGAETGVAASGFLDRIQEIGYS
jgi:hypothetical protein